MIDFSRYSYGVEVVDDGPLTVGSFKADNGDVISHLNISHTKVEDGGVYSCEAVSRSAEISKL